MSTNGNQLHDWTEKLQSTSQSQAYTKKWSWSLFQWSTASLIQYSFLNPSKTIICEKHAQQLDEMHGKLQCLKPASVNRMGPFFSMTKHNLISHNPTLQKLNKLGHGTLASSAIFAWPLDNWLLLRASWKFFSRKVLPQPAGCRKCLPRVCWIPKHRFLCYRNKKTLISHWQKCADCNGSYFD